MIIILQISSDVGMYDVPVFGVKLPHSI